MATIVHGPIGLTRRADHFSGTPRAQAIDRWIFVINSALFVVITLTAFIPDSLMKIDMVKAGQRPPFPVILHVHSVLMGSFLLLLLGQTILMATGRDRLHRLMPRPKRAARSKTFIRGSTTSCCCSFESACCFRCSSGSGCARATATRGFTNGR